MEKEAFDNVRRIERIRLGLAMGEITYENAKKQAEPIIDAINAKGQKIAKKYGKTYKKITFSEIMR